ncbi:MAG: glycosyltransferase family 2 protein [Pseudanabaena sp. M135S2SP2A07QC]|jgi:GT2 family glycosyltransferase|uniref:glycosyltransferase family 2 protein n=1 Tax=Microcystis sp. M158S2 TaxID=2771152 RepID=UPI00258FEB11|nr:glycosyltransferase family 2 protein [Microcystis sp. M158S2]MCA6534569.1 glycosyltransferase family 2 protein [Pseudanabaena sp. M176S2SP2A07QC]MCA6544454.1 glycosyltransferase family 2 protein [Pseudanabaena sp. M074S1SP2A07QC]MCA6548952.1 glycosyltransferase family 2 protein [Pseudanabaena sp. M152S2SP2A07QC]MCA6553375.1 glycosyltransferase family 2 protein [Pseudanabaena sp. M135S2SP2A07QC]MCA6564883.1 glycosyltransferase family 2 protein [Pseudanabaena sp. M151S2SP2A07QC]MCA6571644.1 
MSSNFVSIILVNFNGEDVLVNCLRSLEKFVPKHNSEIIVVDNSSHDNSINIIESKFPDVRLIKLPQNLGFGTGNNVGAREAKGDFLLLLNTDTIVTSNFLPHLLELMSSNSDVGIIGPKLVFPDGKFQVSFSPEISFTGEIRAKKMHKNSYDENKLYLIEKNFQSIRAVDIVVGAAFFIRKDLFDLLGGFDERFFMYFEESDLCKRVRDKGYKVLYTPHISIIHLRGHSVKKLSDRMSLEYRKSQIYYYHKHCQLWEIFCLRVYLLVKFLYEYLKSPNFYNLEIIKLVFVYK